jgi:hypothetical protein
MNHCETQSGKVYGVFFVETANTALNMNIMYELLVLEYGEPIPLWRYTGSDEYLRYIGAIPDKLPTGP